MTLFSRIIIAGLLAFPLIFATFTTYDVKDVKAYTVLPADTSVSIGNEFDLIKSVKQLFNAPVDFTTTTRGPAIVLVNTKLVDYLNANPKVFSQEKVKELFETSCPDHKVYIANLINLFGEEDKFRAAADEFVKKITSVEIAMKAMPFAPTGVTAAVTSVLGEIAKIQAISWIGDKVMAATKKAAEDMDKFINDNTIKLDGTVPLDVGNARIALDVAWKKLVDNAKKEYSAMNDKHDLKIAFCTITYKTHIEKMAEKCNEIIQFQNTFIEHINSLSTVTDPLPSTMAADFTAIKDALKLGFDAFVGKYTAMISDIQVVSAVNVIKSGSALAGFDTAYTTYTSTKTEANLTDLKTKAASFVTFTSGKIDTIWKEIKDDVTVKQVEPIPAMDLATSVTHKSYSGMHKDLNEICDNSVPFTDFATTKKAARDAAIDHLITLLGSIPSLLSDVQAIKAKNVANEKGYDEFRKLLKDFIKKFESHFVATFNGKDYKKLELSFTDLQDDLVAEYEAYMAIQDEQLVKKIIEMSDDTSAVEAGIKILKGHVAKTNTAFLGKIKISSLKDKVTIVKDGVTGASPADGVEDCVAKIEKAVDDFKKSHTGANYLAAIKAILDQITAIKTLWDSFYNEPGVSALNLTKSTKVYTELKESILFYSVYVACATKISDLMNKTSTPTLFDTNKSNLLVILDMMMSIANGGTDSNLSGVKALAVTPGVLFECEKKFRGYSAKTPTAAEFEDLKEVAAKVVLGANVFAKFKTALPAGYTEKPVPEIILPVDLETQMKTSDKDFFDLFEKLSGNEIITEADKTAKGAAFKTACEKLKEFIENDKAKYLTEDSIKEAYKKLEAIFTTATGEYKILIDTYDSYTGSAATGKKTLKDLTDALSNLFTVCDGEWNKIFAAASKTRVPLKATYKKPSGCTSVPVVITGAHKGKFNTLNDSFKAFFTAAQTFIKDGQIATFTSARNAIKNTGIEASDYPTSAATQISRMKQLLSTDLNAIMGLQDNTGAKAVIDTFIGNANSSLKALAGVLTVTDFQVHKEMNPKEVVSDSTVTLRAHYEKIVTKMNLITDDVKKATKKPEPSFITLIDTLKTLKALVDKTAFDVQNPSFGSLRSSVTLAIDGLLACAKGVYDKKELEQKTIALISALKTFFGNNLDGSVMVINQLEATAIVTPGNNKVQVKKEYDDLKLSLNTLIKKINSMKDEDFESKKGEIKSLIDAAKLKVICTLNSEGLENIKGKLEELSKCKTLKELLAATKVVADDIYTHYNKLQESFTGETAKVTLEKLDLVSDEGTKKDNSAAPTSETLTDEEAIKVKEDFTKLQKELDTLMRTVTVENAVSKKPEVNVLFEKITLAIKNKLNNKGDKDGIREFEEMFQNAKKEFEAICSGSAKDVNKLIAVMDKIKAEFDANLQKAIGGGMSLGVKITLIAGGSLIVIFGTVAVVVFVRRRSSTPKLDIENQDPKE